jgi:hypothetical protein
MQSSPISIASRTKPASTPSLPSSTPSVRRLAESPANQTAPDSAHSDPGFVPSNLAEPHFPQQMPAFTGPLAREKRRQWPRKNGFAHLAKAAFATANESTPPFQASTPIRHFALRSPSENPSPVFQTGFFLSLCN